MFVHCTEELKRIATDVLCFRYEKFTQSRTLQASLDRSTYPVEAINYLKTLCRSGKMLLAFFWILIDTVY
jgi:hypothetical protein